MKKISLKEAKIGAAFILAIFMLYYGISFLKGFNIFKSANSYVVVFDNVDGLTSSTPVTINGFQVGQVYSMELDHNNPKHVIAHINMDKGLDIPKGSKMLLDVSVLGTAAISLELNPYTEESMLASDTIFGIRKRGLLDAGDDMLPKVELIMTRIDSVLMGVQALMNSEGLNRSLNDVNAITNNLSKTTDQLSIMTTSLNKNLPAITGNIQNITTDLSQTTNKLKQIDLVSTFNSVDSTMKNIHYISKQATSKNSSLGLLLSDRQLYDSLNATVGNASALLKDVKDNPKRYINVKVF